MANQKELFTQLTTDPNTTSESKEPALKVGAIVTVVLSASYIIVKQVIPNVPDATIDATFSVLAVIVPLVVAWIIRSKVWSPASVQAVTDEAVKQALETAEILQHGQVKLIATETPATPEETL